VGKLETQFGRAVRRLRGQANMGQEKLAEEAALHRTHVSLIERGRRSPGLLVISKLAKALGLTMTELMAAVEAEAKAGPEPVRPKPGRPRKSQPTAPQADGRPRGRSPAPPRSGARPR
jgi:transcriptional regulator with XRE-family HTH domain